MHPALNNDIQASLPKSLGWQRGVRGVVFLCITLLLSACAGSSLGNWSSQSESNAENLANDGRFADSAAMYIGLAGEQQGVERDRLTLLAIQQWLDGNDISRARNAFHAMAKPTTGDNLRLWQMDEAALYLVDNQSEKALLILEPMSREGMPLKFRMRVDALRADANFQQGDPVRAIEILAHRESWLDNAQSIKDNRNRLWHGLLNTDSGTLRRGLALTADAEVRGWLNLASLATTTGQTGSAWSSGLEQWQQANFNHPALLILGKQSAVDSVFLDHPRQIALLLPLSGAAETAGIAIRDGFFGAYFSNQYDPMQTQAIRVYDTASLGVSNAYNQAITDGAQFVIGPLLKKDVTTLAEEPMLPVPVLALNYLPDDLSSPPQFYQFALAPEDEASSAAQRVIMEGQTRGVALIPNNEWGRRVLSSFATELEHSGGTLLEYRSYQIGSQDFSTEIEGLMHLSDSVQRYRRLRANINEPLQFESRRRQDTEFIFLATDANVGRLIKPQLRFHYSGDLPVYSTSSIYAMDGRSDTDLNGVMFADIPWIIEPANQFDGLPDLYRSSWPEKQQLTRLQAMGYDAYKLAPALFSNIAGPLPEIYGATGRLYLDSGGRVHRRLDWAQFRRGQPVALPSLHGFDTNALPPTDSDEPEWLEDTPGE